MAAPGRRGAPEACELSFAELIAQEDAREAVGETFEFRGQAIEIGPDDPALGLRGLAEITDARARPDGLYEIHFGEENTALVDLDRGALAFSGGDDFTQAQLAAAIYRAMAERALLRNEGASHLQQLADALAYHRDELTPQSLALLARAGRDALEAEGRDFAVNPTELYRRFTPAKRPPLLPRAAKREAERALRQMVAHSLRKVEPRLSMAALLHRTDEEGNITGLPPEVEAEREAAAEELEGLQMIPEPRMQLKTVACGKCKGCKSDGGCLNPNIVSEGEYYAGQEELDKILLMRNRYAIGERFFILRGPAGAGKDEFMREAAAGWHKPYKALNIGPGTSIEDLIGSDGLGAHETRDENGNIVNVVSVSDVLEGPLARMAQRPSVCVIQEAAGMKFEMVRLHSLAGDRVGDPSQRVLTINSAKGRLGIPVHPDFVLAVTYNAGEEDEDFGLALHDRGCNLDFEYPEPEEEKRRYALQVKQALKQQTIFPQLAEAEITPEVVDAAVEAMRRLREKKHPMLRRTPGFRQGVKFVCDIIMAGAEDNPMATDRALKTLHYTLPGPETGLSNEERTKTLREIFSDQLSGLDGIADWARKVVHGEGA